MANGFWVWRATTDEDRAKARAIGLSIDAPVNKGSTMSNEKKWTAIHTDTELNEAWWGPQGFDLGHNLFYNSIRDGSGNYDGFALDMPHGDSVIVRTVAEAKIAIKWYRSQQVLYTIRCAGHNTSNWAVWAQKWAAHAMRPHVFPAPPKDAPEEPNKEDQ